MNRTDRMDRTYLARPVACALLLVLALLSSLAAFPIQRDTLNNGLAILTSQDSHLPMVNLLFAVRAGSFDDPSGQAGIASLVAGLLTTGTRTLTSDQIAEKIEYVGGDINSGCDADHSTVSVQVLAKDLDRALDLLADVVRNPAFNDTEVVKLKRRTLAGIRRIGDDPAALLDREFNRRVYGTHPYAHPGAGTDSSVAKFTRENVGAFYNSWYVPNNCYLVAVGDFDRAALIAGLRKRFGDWPRRPVTARTVPPVPEVPKPMGMVITRPEMNQARILIGFEGVREGTADAYPLRLMNFMLGGSVFSSRIGTAIRVERGLAYDARSGFDRRLYGGSFRASTETRTESTQAAISLILQQLRDIRDKGTTAAELQRTKDYFLGNFPLQIEATRDKVSTLDHIELFNLGLDYVDKAPENVRAVTEADVLHAAQNHIFPDRYLLMVIGNLTEKDIAIPGIEWIKAP